jgi:hypothetical protein
MSEEAKEATGASTSKPDEPDLIWGATEIGKVINRTRRQAFSLLENKRLPAKKVGGTWCASPSNLRQALIVRADQPPAGEPAG